MKKMDNTNNYAVIYARFSSHSQDEATIEKQVTECKKA